MQRTDELEKAVYSVICSNDGIKARQIAAAVGADHTTVNRCLYMAPFIKELTYRDEDYLWHGLIRQMRPHRGLGDFTGYYGTVAEFMALEEDAWFEQLLEGCRRIGRNLNDTRGLFHSFRDCGQTMRALFKDIADLGDTDTSDWEIAFELRINRSRYIRIYADVLVLTEDKVFSLEFKMKDAILEEELSQAAKYCPYLEVLFGPAYDVIPVLVLTTASDLYVYRGFGKGTAELPVCSGDMLFNVFDEYLGIING